MKLLAIEAVAKKQRGQLRRARKAMHNALMSLTEIRGYGWSIKTECVDTACSVCIERRGMQKKALDAMNLLHAALGRKT